MSYESIPTNQIKETLRKHVHPINGRPTNGTVKKLMYEISTALGTIENPHCENDGYKGYILTAEARGLICDDAFKVPDNIKDEFQGTNNGKLHNHRVKLARSKTFKNIKKGIKEVMEEMIEPTYHFGGKTEDDGFGNQEPHDIMQQLLRIYKQPDRDETRQYQLMIEGDMQPGEQIEPMLRAMTKANMFLQQAQGSGTGNPALEEDALIDRAMGKIHRAGRFTKLIEEINKTAADKKDTWQKFKKVCNEWVQKQIENGVVSETPATMGYTQTERQGIQGGTAYAGIQDDDESSMHSLVENDIANRMARMTISQQENQQPPQNVYQDQYQAPPPTDAVDLALSANKKRKETHDNNYPAYVQPAGYAPLRPSHNAPFSNTSKRFNNLFCCDTCGVDVDHDGPNCTVAKPGHRWNLSGAHRNIWHTIPGASQKGGHKALPDGTGQLEGFIQAVASDGGQHIREMQRNFHANGGRGTQRANYNRGYNNNGYGGSNQGYNQYRGNGNRGGYQQPQGGRANHYGGNQGYTRNYNNGGRNYQNNRGYGNNNGYNGGY